MAVYEAATLSTDTGGRVIPQRSPLPSLRLSLHIDILSLPPFLLRRGCWKMTALRLTLNMRRGKGPAVRMVKSAIVLNVTYDHDTF